MGSFRIELARQRGKCLWAREGHWAAGMPAQRLRGQGAPVPGRRYLPTPCAMFHAPTNVTYKKSPIVWNIIDNKGVALR